MKYIIQGRPYIGPDYFEREYDTIEEVHAYIKKEGCTVPCEYPRAGLVVYCDDTRIECWTTQHMVDVFNNW